MLKIKPISISKNAFAFCRYFTVILLMLALVLRIESLVFLVFFILLLSAILGIMKAPLIFVYSSLEKFLKFKIKYQVVDIHAMRFAHILGSILSGICVVLFIFENKFAWSLVFIFMILKIVSAMGFCPASKLYTCSTNGNCCQFVKKK